MKVFGIKCKKCGDIIYSRAVHDFHYCSCESCAIDGGQNDYYKIVGDSNSIELLKNIEIGEVTLKDLYDDWNYGTNKYGVIKTAF